MSTLTSSSTLAEIEAAYADNASWEEDASTSKAAAFITACKLLIQKQPSDMTAAGSVGFGRTELEKQIADARQFIAANRTRGSVIHRDFSGVRR